MYFLCIYLQFEELDMETAGFPTSLGPIFKSPKIPLIPVLDYCQQKGNILCIMLQVLSKISPTKTPLGRYSDPSPTVSVSKISDFVGFFLGEKSGGRRSFPRGAMRLPSPQGSCELGPSG